MCSYIIFVVYICRIIACLKGFALFYHIPNTYGMHVSLEHRVMTTDRSSEILLKIRLGTA